MTIAAKPWPPEVELRGGGAHLVPLRPNHAEALAEAARDGELWRLWYTHVPAPEAMDDDITKRLTWRQEGSWLPFAVLDAATGVAVGMTSYLHIDADNCRVEIGATWYRRSVQRTALNTQCKRLLLAHAFETLNCIAVELRTHRLNTQSRRAIERLGAQLDGVLRCHSRDGAGNLRDTCVYSITAAEWPTIRAHLDWQLEKAR